MRGCDWRSPPNPGRVTVELHAGGGFGPRRGGLLNDHRAGLSHHHRIHTATPTTTLSGFRFPPTGEARAHARARHCLARVLSTVRVCILMVCIVPGSMANIPISAGRRTGPYDDSDSLRRARRTRTNASNVHGRRPTFPGWRHSEPGLAWSPVAPERFHGGERRYETAATFATWHFLDGLRRVRRRYDETTATADAAEREIQSVRLLTQTFLERERNGPSCAPRWYLRLGLVNIKLLIAWRRRNRCPGSRRRTHRIRAIARNRARWNGATGTTTT